jgi:hypothetical protein
MNMFVQAPYTPSHNMNFQNTFPSFNYDNQFAMTRLVPSINIASTSANVEMQTAFETFNCESDTSLMELMADFAEEPCTTAASKMGFNGGKELPCKLVYVDQARVKQLNADVAMPLIQQFNGGGAVDFAFPACANTAASDNLFLGWRIAKRMLATGMDTNTIDRTISILGNRHCLGCIKKTKGGKNGDLVGGTMHCNKCLETATGTLDDHIDEFLAMDFNKWARNIKSA